MKRFITLILTLCLCMGIIIPVHAAADMTISVSAPAAAAGETFTVDIAVNNNTGFAYLKLEFTYDTDLFTLVANESMSTVGALTFAAGTTLVSWDSSDDYVASGTIGKISFVTSEEIEEGEYTIGVSVVECFNVAEEDVQVTAEDVKVTIETPASEIISADMVLGTDITVNYYATLDASHIGAQMRFTMNDEETIVDGEETEEEGVYVYPFQKIAPQCMGDNIEAELIFGETVLDTKEEYSIRTYCENTLAKSAAELKMSDEKYAAMQTLIADLLEYGAKAQVYTGHNADALVNEGIEGKSDFIEVDPEMNDEWLEQSNSFTLTGVEFVSAGIYFDYYNAIYVKFKAPNMTDSNFRVRLKDAEENILGTYKLSECTLVDEANNTYLLVLPGLYATQFEDFYIIELCKYTTRATTMQWSLNYGIASYVCAKQNKTDAEGNLTPMAELTRATYNYGLSATAYNVIAD